MHVYAVPTSPRPACLLKCTIQTPSHIPALHPCHLQEIKAFYMKLNEDGKTVAAMDVLVPKVGGQQRLGMLNFLNILNSTCKRIAA